MNCFRNHRAAAWGLALLATLIHGWLAAQTVPRPPDRIAYQGYLTGGDGLPLANAVPRAYDLLIKIFSAESGGTQLWLEQQTVTIDKGYFSILIGEGSGVTGFTNSAAGLGSVFQGGTASDRYVGITIKGIGSNGSDVDIVPRVRLLSAPYAYLAQSATRLVDAAGADAVTTASTGITFSSPITASAVSAPSVAVGGITVTNSITLAGSGASLGGPVQTSEGPVRLISGRHRWTGTNSAAYPGTATATFVTEPSPGYAVTRVSAGEYRIVFDVAFNSIPSVTVTTILPAITYPAGYYWNTAWAVVEQSTDPTVACRQVTVRIFSFQDSPTLRAYSYQTYGNGLTSNNLQYYVNTIYGTEPITISSQIDWDFQFHAAGS